MPWQVQLLGGLRVRGEGRDLPGFGTAKASALFSYLASRTPAFSSRAELAEMLWPDQEPVKARNSLSSALTIIRQALREPSSTAIQVTEGDRRSIRLRPELFNTDVAAFERAVKQARLAESLAERAALARSCAALYAGDFVPDLDWPWVLAERRRLEALHLQVVKEAIAALRKLGEGDRARQVVQQARTRAPESSELQMIEIQLLANLGHTSDARTLARSYARWCERSDIDLDDSLASLLRQTDTRTSASVADPERLVAEGQRLLAEGRAPAALARFVDAAVGPPDKLPDEVEALRLGLTLHACPLPKAWHDEGEALTCCDVGRTGWVAAGRRDGTIVLWDPDRDVVRKMKTAGAALTQLAVAAASNRVVAIDAARQVHLRQLSSRRVVAVEPGALPETPNCLALSPDHRFAAVGDDSGHVLVIDLHTGAGHLWQAHHRTQAVVFARHGELLVSGGSEGRLRGWDPVSGRELDLGWSPGGKITCLAVSPDGGRLACADGHGRALVWSWAEPEREPVVVRHPTKAITAVTFSPDGLNLATGGGDGMVRRWRLAEGVAIEQPGKLSGDCREIRFRPDGLALLCLSRERPATLLWSATLEPLLAPLEAVGTVVGCGFRGDGQHVVSVSAAGELALWDVMGPLPEQRRVHQRLRHVSQAALWCRAGQLATAGVDGFVRVESLHGEGRSHRLRHPAAVWQVALSPDSKHVATACHDGVVRLWSAADGAPLGELVHDDDVRRVAFNADGSLLATASRDGTARVWTVPAGRAVGPCLEHDELVRGARFVRQGGSLLTVDRTGHLRNWRVSTGEARWEVNHPGLAWDLAVSPDERCVVVVGTGSVATVVATGTGARLPGAWQVAGTAMAVAISPDSRRVMVATQEGLVRVFEVETGAVALPDLQHAEWVHGGLFGPHGDWLATWSDDHTVRFWDGHNGHPLGVPLPHLSLVNHATYCESGRVLATACSDGHAYVWELAGVTWSRSDWRQAAALVNGSGSQLELLHRGSSAQRVWREIQADRCLQEGCLAGAALHVEALAAERPDDAQAASRQAWLAVARGDWAAAAAAYAVAAEDPNQQPLILAEWAIGALVHDRPTFAGVAARLAEVLAAIPRSQLRWAGLRALALAVEGRIHLARLDLDASCPAPYEKESRSLETWAAVLYRQAKCDSAIEAMARAWHPPRNPRTTFGYALLALCHGREGRYVEAARLAAQARLLWENTDIKADWLEQTETSLLLAEVRQVVSG